jgi:uncharacterized protein (DUF1697 family)
MIYLALLRGINVGGKTKVEMPRLKAVFEALGCQDVTTYINSGNVIFSDKRTAKDLVPLIEAALNKEFKLSLRVVLRDAANLKKLCHKIPSKWTNDGEQKTDVMFLWEEIDSKDILQKIVIKPEIENVLHVDGALVWNIGRQNVTKGSSIKLIKTDVYLHMTVRNVNTVRKLHSLMSAKQNN